jgi:MFS family permease
VLGVDLTPLRDSKQYRRLYLAGFISGMGSQATYVTIPYQLKQLTHSPLQVGALGLVGVIPLIVFGLYGGVIADRFNRRRIVITTEFAALATTAALLANALLPHPQAWELFVNEFLGVSIFSLQRPSIEAMYQKLVRHEHQKAASQLGNLRYMIPSIAGPAVGGLAAVSVGPWSVYVTNLITFTLSLYLLYSLDKTPVEPGNTESQREAVSAGLSYVRSRPDIVGTYIVDLLAMFLAFPIIMLPFVAERFHYRFTLSLLYCAIPVGAVIGTMTSGWSKRVYHYGRWVVAAAATWGLGIALFGYSNSLLLVLLGLFIAGLADSISGIFRMTMWNESIPPSVRGRMAGIEMISYAVGPTAGQFRAGAMAAWTSLRFSLTVGGLACSGAIGGVALALPSLWKFDARTDVNVELVRQERS